LVAYGTRWGFGFSIIGGIATSTLSAFSNESGEGVAGREFADP
jgi:hypothetical protein